MVCLKVDGFTATNTDWTEIGDSPYLDTYTYADRIQTQLDGAVESDFTFEDAPITGKPTTVEIEIWSDEDMVSNDVTEVWMWENVGGWEKAGEFNPDMVLAKYSFDVSAKFNSYAKINEAKLKFIYRGVAK